ncbi:caspase family protein [Lyngbya sp. PCC 8106]|uniref:caspase family protein n=1 Tax=Lyngbya sp. (strain PCC 8106) TaxID=313612 RepID=UPI0000EA9092|nr:caspase family protein [Lyngbya sp. PCC 8106]EAW35263.1 Peptidase C14, caspase catalytic subunit p20 [Lyngbya sp. PCC 8106]
MTTNLYALLIGNDCYLPNKLPDGGSFGSLKGCVRDITLVEEYLKNSYNLKDENLLKLTSTNDPNNPNQPLEDSSLWPSYKNMIAKFQQITEMAQPNDRVYIHYSGHGGRTPTNYPDLKGDQGVDETLVPNDLGMEEGQYLRDLELAELLQNMVKKGLIVTVVLDSCHSGGASRDEENQDYDVRGLNIIDTTPRPTESLVASPEKLMQTWENLTAGGRNVTAAGLLPQPKGYTLLAACQDNQSAYETTFEGQRHGAMTYWLINSLKKLGSEITYQSLHNRLLANINSDNNKQTPMLHGEGDRLFLSSEGTSYQLAVPVMNIDAAKNRVQLQVGEATGVSKGAEFVIYSPGISDFSQTDKRVAIVKIAEVGAVESWAEIKQFFGENTFENIEKGASSLLLNPGVKLVKKVRLLPTASDFSELENVKSTVQGHNCIEWVSGDRVGDDFAYQVRINESGEYEILNKVGEPISNIRPALKVDEPQAAETLMKRLVHLAKYQTVMQLDNNDPASKLAGKIKVELCKAGEGRELIPFDEPGNIPTVDVDEFVYLRIRNESPQNLNIAVLAMQPDWSIGKLHPDGADYEILERGQETLVRFNTSLPEGYTEGDDILKVFATAKGTSFDWLQLPALDQPKIEITGKSASNPLEELFSAIADENPDPKNVTRAVFASDEWTTEQVKLVVKESL